jgi:hypothetical protein
MSHLKTLSSQHIISKIARTFKPSDSHWINDALEDIGWAIQAIGYHAGFVDKETEPPYITVLHHRGKIPCDVERILAVESLVAVSGSSKVLNPDGTTPFPQPDPTDSCTYKGVKMTLSSDISLGTISETTPKTSRMNTELLTNTYSLNDNYVITGFEKGLIKLIYKGFPLDKEGMPMIIDDFDYKSCLEFYCVSQMLLRGWKHPVMDYDRAFASFNFYLPKAENAVKMLSLDRAQRFEASWNRYVRSVDFSGNYFAGLEQTEYISR